jgi:hypothetical protein
MDVQTEIPDGRPPQWQDWVTLVIGGWLIAAPWLIYGPAASGFVLWNSWLIGGAIVVLALSAILKFHEWEEWISGVLGLWLIASPWVLGFADMGAAMWNAVISGAVVIAMAAEELWEIRHFGQKEA